MANSHRRRNTFLNISIHGAFQEGLVGVFQNLLSAPNSWRPPLPDISFNVIGDEQGAKLEEMFTEEEILATISGLSGDKASGPDGFPLAIWSFNWDFVKNEVLGFFKEFTNTIDSLKVSMLLS